MTLFAAPRRLWRTFRGTRRVAAALAPFARDPARTLRDELEEAAAAHRDRPALVGAGESLSFRDLYTEVNRWARWTIVNAVAPGETVALLLDHRPGLLPAHAGIAATGAVAGLLDPALAGERLARAVEAFAPGHLVVDAALLPRFETAAPHLGTPVAVWVHGPHTMAYLRVDEALADLSPVRLVGRDRRTLRRDDAAVRLAAAAPDGPPRLVALTHGALLDGMVALAAAADLGPRDRLLLPRPAVRDADALLALGGTLTRGAECRLADADALADDVARTRPSWLGLDADGWRRFADLAEAGAVPPGLVGATGPGLDPTTAARLAARVPRCLLLPRRTAEDARAVHHDYTGDAHGNLHLLS